MQKTKEAIKYGLETMGVTPKEMFSLIESSNGYEGEDYNRWLTGQIIKIAEKDGVGYSQLLAKWFNIISSIMEESTDLSMKDYWKGRFSSMLHDSSVYTVGMGEENEFGVSLDDVDWFDGVDIPWNTMFVDEKLPPEVSEKLHNGERVAFLINTDAKLQMSKSSSLLQNAKASGVVCANAGALMLYRMCNMVSALDSVDNISVVVVSDTAFLLNKENHGVIKYFLSVFNYSDDSFVVNSKDLYTSAFMSEDYAVLCCKSRDGDIQDGVLLNKYIGNGTYCGTLRYCGGGNMLQKLEREAPSFNSDSVYMLSPDGRTLTGELGVGYDDSLEQDKLLGYLCKSSRSRTAILTSAPVEGTKYIPIVVANLNDVIAYYGVTTALQNVGLPCDINELPTGHPEYTALVANCVPVFLFGVGSNFCELNGENGVHIRNCMDIESSSVVAHLLDKSSQYFGYEAKELMGVCKGFLDFLAERGESMVGKTFAEVRAEADHTDLNNAYINALSRCLDYISTLYRKM